MGDIRSFVFAVEDTETTQGLYKIIGRSSSYDQKRLCGPNNLYFDEPELSKKHAILCIKTPRPKICGVSPIGQLRIYIRDLSSKSGIVNLESDGPNDEIDLKSGDTFGLIAVANHPLHHNHNLAAKLILRIKLEYFDEEKGLLKCTIVNVTSQINGSSLSSSVYSPTLTDNSDSSWYGLSDCSMHIGNAEECHETKTIMTRGGRFSILSLRKKDNKSYQKADINNLEEHLETTSLREEIDTCTDTDTTEEEEEEEEEKEEKEEQDIELEIIRIKRIRRRPKTKETLTSFSRNKRMTTPPQQSNSMWILLIIILVIDRLLSN
ncbi:YGL081W [Saccharomyces arboricola H-6]|uniref:YGL081W n=1 Tax=Saccharomyces arboricola (strain H-6 / AS 2.3317 / CBS 10644) TaxID=1160507 RepID=J8Q844_SACAR|nr:YGL081W [Saccharomyces arboricola H-6]